MHQGCCSYGAHFVDEDDVQTVVRAAVRLTSKEWQFIKRGKRVERLYFAPGDPAQDAQRLASLAETVLAEVPFARRSEVELRLQVHAGGAL